MTKHSSIGKIATTRKHLLLMMTMLALLCGCSTQKNTPGVRFYHATTARFNTFYNGQIAFDKGVFAQDKGHKDDYTQLIPMYVSTSKASQSLGKSDFETAITKCEKAIKVHSIKKRPETKSGKRKTAKEKQYLARKEFNPFLYRAWLLMAESQFRKGDFIECASTCNYILRLYQAQPEVANIAKAWLARCYVALEWPYDAEDVLSKMSRDSLTIPALREKEKTQAAHLIYTGQYQKAIPYLERSIKHTKGKLQRSRLKFLLGQLYYTTGNMPMAYKAFGRVIRSNPPYELAFTARIKQTEAVTGDRSKQMIGKLRRMSRSDKNQDFLDQIYYAMGNIYLSAQDTAKAIGAYEKGAQESKRNSIAKAVLLLKLSQIYWEQENYIEASRTYNACGSILDREHDLYEEVKQRSSTLKELEPQLSAIKLQDSLQALAKMNETERNKALDRVIELLKQKEKEEEKKKAEAEMANRDGQLNQNRPGNRPIQQGVTAVGQGEWYFYNPNAVERGKKEFQKQWGKRRNEDNWRYSSREGLPESALAKAGNNIEEAPSNHQQEADIIQHNEDSIAKLEAMKDSLANDPHQREYYMKDIPFTEEQMDASNEILSKALYKSGILEQEKLENFPRAKRTLERLVKDFPKFAEMDNVYYHLFLVSGRLKDADAAAYYKQELAKSFPKSKLTQTVTNPNYELLAQKGTQLEDSIYAAAYRAYSASDYAQVEKNYQWYTENFEKGKHHARMLFVRAMSNLYAGKRDTFMVTLKEVIKRYPKEEVTELADAIVKGMKDGRTLMNDRHDASSIWNMRTRQNVEGDSTKATPVLNDERTGLFAFVLAYPTGGLNEDQLVFEMARYNFTNFMVRNFDLEISQQNGITFMAIKGFQSYDEVHSYAQMLYADKQMAPIVKDIRSMLISEENLKLIGTDFSFEEYKDFYEKKLAPIELPEDFILDEPTDLEIKNAEEVEEESEQTPEEGEEENIDDFPFGF